MTLRAIIVGVLLAVGFACYGATNGVWSKYSGIGGDLVPNYAYALLLLGVLGINPLLHLLRRRRVRSAEWVVMLSLAVMGCFIAGSGLLWTFPHPIVTPLHDQPGNPDWITKDLLGYVPGPMLVNARPAPGGAIPDVARNYVSGMGRPGKHLGLSAVPWRAWSPALAFWFALLGLLFTAMLCGVLVVHRQWSRREHLAYPIATFAAELIGPADQLGPSPPVFRQKAFWVGFAVSFGVLAVNGAHAWLPEVPAIGTGVDLSGLRELTVLAPLLKVPTYGKSILDVQFFFAAVGLAYFVSSEVSFSLGVSSWLYVLCAAPLVARGVDMSVSTFAGGLPLYAYFGAYLGMAVTVLYLGRRFYAAVLKRAMGAGGPSAAVLPGEVWAARVGIAACVAAVVLLWRVGLHPLPAAAFVMLVGVMFLMIGRVNAATGLFIIQPMWHPVDVIAGALGAQALGPQAMVVLALLCIVVTLDPRIALAPLALNALRLAEGRKLDPARLTRWMGVAVILAMIVGVGAAVYVQYDVGVAGMTSDNARWSMTVARMPFNMLSQSIDRMTEAQLDAARRPWTISRLLEAAPARHFLAAIGVGMALVIGCSALRLRSTRWPLHPVMFLVWGSPWMIVYAPCFLLAWLIKAVVLKYGSQETYRRSRTFFAGLICGEIAAATVFLVVGVLYHLQTAGVAVPYHVRP